MTDTKPSHSSSHSNSHKSSSSSSSHSKPTHKSSYPDSKPYDGGYVSTSTYLKNRKTGSWPSSSSKNKTEKGGVLIYPVDTGECVC